MITDIYAAALSVKEKPDTIRQWVCRRELTHHGYDRRRRVRVDLDELCDLVAAKREARQAERVDHGSDLLS
ncbi:hypothetical protein [Streptomyces fructofermentans]|uniref:Uncharacterized protein n=1 Tax=Streptomyces fructofermentans TaxID=152141 RepID=A0A918U5U3_9ACTN|nr:hypothetical protein [Streptomyces fructofermentans]GGX99267.1 hypothetical protein GCM10010515_76820 [Streptomyces fructofermentans]